MQTQAAGPQKSLRKVDQHKDHHIFHYVSDSPRSRPSRGLNFTDILNYMDAFKVQFQDKPKVYNGFLAIMRDFENQMCVVKVAFDYGLFILLIPSASILLASSNRYRGYSMRNLGSSEHSTCSSQLGIA